MSLLLLQLNHPYQLQLPQIGESIIIPVVAPLASVIVTYFGIVLYDFIKEQQDKKYLKSTFGAYISPDLIDQNVIYAKLLVKPTRAVEFFAIDFVVTNSGASFED